MIFGERSERQFRGVQLLVAVVALGTMLLLVPGLSLAAGKSDKSEAKRQEAEALIQRAIAVSDVRAEGSAEFGMRGTILVNGAKKHVAQGNYLLLWTAPDRWREEIQFHDYSRIRVGAKNAYWQTRSIDHELLPINDISDALSFPMHLRAMLLSTPDRAKFEIARRKIEGRKAECLLFTPTKKNGTQEYCFDAQDGNLVSEYNTSWAAGAKVEYTKFATFSGKFFPGMIQVKRGDEVEVQFHLNAILPLGKTDDATFEASPNAALWGSCTDGDHPVVLHAPLPEPAMISQDMIGSVHVYAVVGTDGMLHNLKVLPESDPRFAPSTLEAISRWNYAPALCGGTPLPVEIVVTIGYDFILAR